MATKSTKFDSLKAKWDMNYITISSLAGWVRLNDKKPGIGITREEFQEITGLEYAE